MHKLILYSKLIDIITLLNMNIHFSFTDANDLSSLTSLIELYLENNAISDILPGIIAWWTICFRILHCKLNMFYNIQYILTIKCVSLFNLFFPEVFQFNHRRNIMLSVKCNQFIHVNGLSQIIKIVLLNNLSNY